VRQTLSGHLSDEKTRIADALAACNWNRVRAAEMLGMPRRTFYRRLKQYQLQ
jgi:transcriptional regulator of acetoin/glycerol metabolism